MLRPLRLTVHQGSVGIAPFVYHEVSLLVVVDGNRNWLSWCYLWLLLCTGALRRQTNNTIVPVLDAPLPANAEEASDSCHTESLPPTFTVVIIACVQRISFVLGSERTPQPTHVVDRIYRRSPHNKRHLTLVTQSHFLQLSLL
jgi:hypothetical protein